MKQKLIAKSLSLLLILTLPIFSHRLAMGNENNTEQHFIQAGLVDVRTIDPSIKIDLVNSDSNKNFFRENFYNGLTRAYLQKEVAIKLSKAQAILKSKDSNLSLQILDAARPLSVSKKMYEKMKGTRFEHYVANPKKGSMHNYGIAVDITIVDENDKELDMGFSPFRKSKAALILQFAKIKLGFDLTKDQTENRKLLATVMEEAGFFPLSHEWWHFNGLPKVETRKKYAIIE